MVMMMMMLIISLLVGQNILVKTMMIGAENSVGLNVVKIQILMMMAMTMSGDKYCNGNDEMHDTTTYMSVPKYIMTTSMTLLTAIHLMS